MPKTDNFHGGEGETLGWMRIEGQLKLVRIKPVEKSELREMIEDIVREVIEKNHLIKD